MQENTHVHRFSLQCSTHATPAHEAFVLPLEKKGNMSLFCPCLGVLYFLHDEDRCSGPMKNYSSLLLLQSDKCEMMSIFLLTVSRSGLCKLFKAQHPSRPTAYPHVGVHTYFALNITAACEVLPPKNRLFFSVGAPNLVHLTGERIVFGMEKYFDGIQYLDIYPNNSGYGYDITIYHDISCDITPDHRETPGKYENKINENPSPRCGLLLFQICIYPQLRLSCVWPFLASFYCPLAGNIIGLTVPSAKSRRFPSGRCLLHGRMFFCFITTWYRYVITD